MRQVHLLELLDERAEALIFNSDLDKVLRWTERLPLETLSHFPRLCIYYAWALQFELQLEAAERAWRDRFGTTFVEDLRAALVGRVQRVDVELPHFPTGYGQGDSSMTGGAFVPGESGPPRIPPHGEEWPVVLREDREAVWRDYPLSDDALAALRADDVAALAPRVNPYLLRFYFAATGMPDANFIAKLREGAHG